MVEKEQAQVFPYGRLSAWGNRRWTNWTGDILCDWLVEVHIWLSLAGPKLEVHGTGGQILGQLSVILVINLGHCGTIVTGRVSYCLASWTGCWTWWSEFYFYM